MTDEQVLRTLLVQQLEGGHAHIKTMDVLNKYPADIINQKLPNVSYTPWQLLEHMRIGQYDILEFIRNPDYNSPEWPAGYWPDKDKQADTETWQSTLTSFWVDLSEAVKIALDPETDLFSPIPHAEDYTILRELLLIADHNAYHLAQMVLFSKTFVK